LEKFKELEKILKKENIFYNEPMSKHTTMKVGGPAKVLVEPTDVDEIKNVIEFARENDIQYYLLGKGSNLVVDDSGVDGIVIKISNKFANVRVENEKIYAESGASMPLVAIEAQKNGLTGFEFACGIPGTIGGGIKMNAGAYGGEISDVADSIEYIDEEGKICNISANEANFSYRDSIFKRNSNLVVLSAVFKLKAGKKDEIIAKMNENNASRRAKQPIELPNSGSVFKRPEGHFVGPMIIECGLQGKTVGGAQVSKKHAGFIVNIGGATSSDIKELIEIIKKEVDKKFNVKLETEIQFIGGK